MISIFSIFVALNSEIHKQAICSVVAPPNNSFWEIHRQTDRQTENVTESRWVGA
jgi:hypothetical protein